MRTWACLLKRQGRNLIGSEHLGFFFFLFSELKHVRYRLIIRGELPVWGGHWREESPRLLSPRNWSGSLGCRFPGMGLSVSRSTQIGQVSGGFSVKCKKGFPGTVSGSPGHAALGCYFSVRVAASPSQHVCACTHRRATPVCRPGPAGPVVGPRGVG